MKSREYFAEKIGKLLGMDSAQSEWFKKRLLEERLVDEIMVEAYESAMLRCEKIATAERIENKYSPCCRATATTIQNIIANQRTVK